MCIEDSEMERSSFDFIDFFNRAAVMETFVDVLLCVFPIWVAVMIGLVIGWSWRPRWTGLVYLGLRSKLRFIWTVPPWLGAQRLWLAVTALSAFSVGRTLWSRLRERFNKPLPAAATSGLATLAQVGPSSRVVSVGGSGGDITPSCNATSQIEDVISDNDLEHFLFLLASQDGKMGWQHIMGHSTPNLTFQAWRYEPQTGPIVYCSRTVFEDATPETVRDFFWDDDFRLKWDPMLSYFKILKECPHTGTMVVHWIKKFPFLCSDREYIIGRRIWEAGNSYYCVTKAVPFSSLQRHSTPLRVDHFFSSWVIKPVPSGKGDGELSACEVTLVHYEDTGIPKDLARLVVRHRMRGAVNKMHIGFRAYQQLATNSEAPLSRSVLLARITTKISIEENPNSLEPIHGEEEKPQALAVVQGHGDRGGGFDWKLIAIGVAVALVCGLRPRTVGKSLLLGAGPRRAQK